MELWVLRISCFIGWVLVGWFIIRFVRRRNPIFGDLIIDETSSEVFLHCPHQPEELLDHRYITLKIINFNGKRSRK